jgi:hypothetical protein
MSKFNWEIVAALVVLFSAMWNPRVSVAVSVVALVLLAIFERKKTKIN